MGTQLINSYIIIAFIIVYYFFNIIYVVFGFSKDVIYSIVNKKFISDKYSKLRLIIKENYEYKCLYLIKMGIIGMDLCSNP